jgi:hypothetical protein
MEARFILAHDFKGFCPLFMMAGSIVSMPVVKQRSWQKGKGKQKFSSQGSQGTERERQMGPEQNIATKDILPVS